jgi:AraC-like DNA-binding protein
LHITGKQPIEILNVFFRLKDALKFNLTKCPFVTGFDMLSIIILFGALQTLTLSLIFLLKEMKSFYGFIGWSMACLTVIQFESFMNYTGYVQYTPWIINTSASLIFLLGPLLLFQTWSANLKPTTIRTVALHFFPFIFYFLYSFFFFLQPDSYKINAVFADFHPHLFSNEVVASSLVDPIDIRGFVIVEGLSLHLLIYAIISYLLLFPLGGTNGTSGSHKTNIQRRWLKFWTFALLTGGIVFLLTGGVVNGYVLFKSILPDYAVNLFCVVLSYACTFFWIRYSLIPTLSRPKYAKSNLDQDVQRHKLHLLKEIMANQKPYKDPDFSLTHLAQLVGMTPHHVSQIINGGLDITFHEFVNQYRIEEAKRVLQSTEGNTLKMENLAYELGYKSKSSFFTSFKKFTKATPSQFRSETNLSVLSFSRQD